MPMRVSQIVYKFGLNLLFIENVKKSLKRSAEDEDEKPEVTEKKRKLDE